MNPNPNPNPNPNNNISTSTGYPYPQSHPGAGPSAPADQQGTHVMGTPAGPTYHPDNKKAAAGEPYYTQPYVQCSPAPKPGNTPIEAIRSKFNIWGKKAETVGNNVWHNLKTGSSVSGDAWGKVNLAAKAASGGGFDALYKQSFDTFPNETLKKYYACYLSTTTGPVAGTMYLSNVHVAFCSDQPLSFKAPSGQESWTIYKVMVPLQRVASINPVIKPGKESEKYIQIVTFDGHDFWFMGLVNFDKASQHLRESIASFAPPGPAPRP